MGEESGEQIVKRMAEGTGFVQSGAKEAHERPYSLQLPERRL